MHNFNISYRTTKPVQIKLTQLRLLELYFLGYSLGHSPKYRSYTANLTLHICFRKWILLTYAYTGIYIHITSILHKNEKQNKINRKKLK